MAAICIEKKVLQRTYLRVFLAASHFGGRTRRDFPEITTTPLQASSISSTDQPDHRAPTLRFSSSRHLRCATLLSIVRNVHARIHAHRTLGLYIVFLLPDQSPAHSLPQLRIAGSRAGFCSDIRILFANDHDCCLIVLKSSCCV